MNEDLEDLIEIPVPKKNSFWRKLGGGSLTVSIIIHVILLMLAAIWIIRIIPPAEEKKVDFMPSGGGGGSPASQERSMQKQKAAVMKPNASRIAVQGVASNISLPEMDASSQLSSLGALSGGMSGGLGGTGSGGGRGDGFGKGFGSGTGPGAGLGSGTANPFGLADPNASALEGVLYDFKQDRRQKPISPITTTRNIIEFCTNSWRDSKLKDFYSAQRKLYQTKIYIPAMSANAAPAAFQVENEVKPSGWMVVYRGNVIAPKSGRFRFVGAGDDTMVVRFNGTNVLDHGFTSGTTGEEIFRVVDVFSGAKENRDVEGRLKRNFPVKLPVTFYQYPTTANYNGQIGGLAAGAEFDVIAGKAYPIDILISEVPGGLFGAVLLIEEMGATYQKAATGAPILPLFRTDNSQPPQKGENAPPYDASGPIWQIKKGAGIGF